MASEPLGTKIGFRSNDGEVKYVEFDCYRVASIEFEQWDGPVLVAQQTLEILPLCEPESTRE